MSYLQRRHAFKNLRESLVLLVDTQRVVLDSEKLEHGPGRICAGCPSSLCSGVAGQSHPNPLESTLVVDGLSRSYVRPSKKRKQQVVGMCQWS